MSGSGKECLMNPESGHEGQPSVSAGELSLKGEEVLPVCIFWVQLPGKLASVGAQPGFPGAQPESVGSPAGMIDSQLNCSKNQPPNSLPNLAGCQTWPTTEFGLTRFAAADMAYVSPFEGFWLLCSTTHFSSVAHL